MSNHPGRFIWYELTTSDVDAALAFYGAVVGWTVQDSGMPGMDYRILLADGVMIGGAMAIPAGAAAAKGMQPAWLGYVSVADVDASVTGLLAAGGAKLVPANDIPGVGRIAMVADPHGAAFYVMTPASGEQSVAFAAVKPGHVGWNELHTTDRDAALAFYTAQFGWGRSTAIDMGPMGIYQLFNAGGEDIGGMMNNPNVPGPGWLYYFNVDDIEAAKARVTAAGGTVANGPTEVPGGLWVIQGRDPQGGPFALVGPRRA